MKEMALFIQTELREEKNVKVNIEELRVEEKWHCSYKRSLERRKNVKVNIDGAKSEREMALSIQTELREEKM